MDEDKCNQLTECKGTGGTCSSTAEKGIHCDCGKDIIYDNILGCKGKIFY